MSVVGRGRMTIVPQVVLPRPDPWAGLGRGLGRLLVRPGWVQAGSGRRPTTSTHQCRRSMQAGSGRLGSTCPASAGMPTKREQSPIL